MWSRQPQTCVAPDYVIVPREQQDELISALRAQCDSLYPEGALNSSSYGRIVSDGHFNRLKGLLEGTRGEICFGGKTSDNRGFEPTIVKNVDEGDSLLEEYARTFSSNGCSSNLEFQGDIRPNPANSSGQQYRGRDRVRQCSVSSPWPYPNDYEHFFGFSDHPLALYAFTEDPGTKDYSQFGSFSVQIAHAINTIDY